MGIPIIDSLFLGSDQPLDSRSVQINALDVSRYFHSGFYGYETANDVPFYIDNSLNVRYFLTSDSSTFTPVSAQGDLNEVQITDGSGNFTASKLFYNDSNKTLTLGNPSASTSTRRIGVDGSPTNIGLNLISKGRGPIGLILGDNSNSLFLDEDSLLVGPGFSYLDIDYLSIGQKISADGLSPNYDIILNPKGTGSVNVTTDLSVNGKTTTIEFNVSGTEFPSFPSTGDQYYRTDLDKLFSYDGGRSKWLSVERSNYVGAIERANGSTITYLQVGTAEMSDETGFLMPFDGTIINMAVRNRNTMNADRTMSIRINDVSAWDLIIPNGGLQSSVTNANADFSSGDLIQVRFEDDGANNVRDAFVSFSVAWRE